MSKLLSLLAMLLLPVCLSAGLTVSVGAATPGSVRLGAVTLDDGYYLKEGTTTPTSAKPTSGGYAYYKSGVLQLNNFDIQTTTTTNGIYATSGDVIVELVGANTIKTEKKGIYTQKGALTVRGSGSLSITATGSTHGMYITGRCTIEGGTLNVTTTGADADAVYVDSEYTQKAGRVTLKSMARCLITMGYTYLHGGSLTLDVCNSDSYTAWRTYNDIYISNGDLTITGFASYGISSDVDNVIINGSAEIDIDVYRYGISCKQLSIDDVDSLLVSSGSGYAAFDTHSLYIDSNLASSGSLTNDGNNAYVLTSANHKDSKYAYIRSDIDLYVGGIPMSIGDYLHQSWGAASTYKPKDNYARVDLNGDADELYLKNFSIDTANNKITSTAITSSSSLKLYIDGVNSINSGAGDAICINKGSMNVISGGTLNITTTTGRGIHLKDGDYIHGGNATINITSTDGTAVDVMNKNITVNNGELNVTAKYDGICCNTFTVKGGKVDTRSTNNQSNKGLSYNTISYGSLDAKAASTVNGALVNLTSAHKNANKRVVIVSHVCAGQKVAGVDAGCTTNGKQAYYKCSCGKLYEDVNCTKVISNINNWGIIPPKNHTPIVGWKSDGTYHWKTCAKCSIAEIPNTKVKHSGGEATCRAKAMCDICKAYYGKTGTHKWSSTWDYATAEGHTHFCVNDGCDIVSTYEKHVPDISAPTESQAQKCKLCDYTIAPALGHVCKSHVFKVDYHGATCTEYGNIEYYECTCGRYYKDKNAATEITDKTSVRIPKADHEYSDKWYFDANGHWQQCGCMKTGNQATHKDDNADYVCDVCSYALPKPPATPTTPADTAVFDDPAESTEPIESTKPTDSTDPAITESPDDSDNTTTRPDTDAPDSETDTASAVTTDEGGSKNDGGGNLLWLWILIASIAVCGITFFIFWAGKKKNQ
ncbi:MAG: carbohydrate-binding domain-containing protein [Clostridia bacterium]|nr:carbohydrate-binding domain-containing protein [Clostridia bacterium]